MSPLSPHCHPQPSDCSNTIVMPPGQDEAEAEPEEKEEEAEGPEDGCSRAVGKVQDAVYGFFTEHADLLWKLFYFVLLLLYVAYFIGALTYR